MSNKSQQWVLFVCCALNELFFIALYLLCFSSPTITPSLLPVNGVAGEPLSLLPGSPAVPKPSTFFASPFSAAAMEYARANKMDSTVPWILCAISFPVMAFKQIVNVIQLVEASRWLAEGDRKMRKQAGLEKKR
jgi:CDP-diacylglycerol--inositol 3-phosphatidyltransferase